MKKMGRLIVSMILLTLAPTAFAVKMNALYQANISVTSQSAEEREQAVQKALAEVLIKITGSNQILTNPALKSLASPADALMQEFSYLPAKPQTPAGAAPFILNVQFNPDGTNQLLRDAGAPIWGQNRPLMLAWVDFTGTDSATDTEVISSDSTSPWADALKKSAARHGLPLIFPLMDTTDLNSVVGDNIQAANVALAKATERYAAPILLVGHISQKANSFATQWQLFIDHDQWNWVISGNTVDQIAEGLMVPLASTLAGRYAAITTNQVQQTITLQVGQINQQTQFSDLIHYLEHLTPVAEVAILRISGSEIVLNVSIRSSQQVFMQAIALGQKLIPVPSQGTTALAYQWGP